MLVSLPRRESEIERMSQQDQVLLVPFPLSKSILLQGSFCSNFRSIYLLQSH